MSSVNWLSVREMIRLQTLVTAWKIVKLGSLQHLADKIIIHPDMSITTSRPRLLNTAMGLRWRVCQQWGMLSEELRNINSLPRFKHRMKVWIKSQRLTANQDPDMNQDQNLDPGLDLDPDPDPDPNQLRVPDL